MDEKIKNILDRLSKSKFRSSFHLKDKDILYIEENMLMILLLKDFLILLMLLMVNKRQ